MYICLKFYGKFLLILYDLMVITGKKKAIALFAIAFNAFYFFSFKRSRISVKRTSSAEGAGGAGGASSA